jgi:hypothetical protein
MVVWSIVSIDGCAVDSIDLMTMDSVSIMQLQYRRNTPCVEVLVMIEVMSLMSIPHGQGMR